MVDILGKSHKSLGESVAVSRKAQSQEKEEQATEVEAVESQEKEEHAAE
jgi:hypothetical protein